MADRERFPRLTGRSIAEQLDSASLIFVAAILGFWLLVFGVKKVLDRYVGRYADHPGDGDAATRDD